MGVSWPEFRLNEVYDFRSGLSKPRSAFGSGHGFLTFKDVFYNTFTPDRLGDLVDSTDRERDLCSIRRGDVFLTRTSETQDELGMSSVALRDYEGATFNGFCKRLRPKDGDEIVPEYAAYFFRGPAFRRAVTAMSSLSTRASLNEEMLERLTISLPPRETQTAIGRILKTLDDKIELNRKMNVTLEAMARALFKSWFVDFDPVRAKAEGRAPSGMDAETAKLFPSEFVESELGMIPSGWQVIPLSEIAGITSGKRPTERHDVATTIASVPLFGGGGVMAYVSEPLLQQRAILTGRVGTLGLLFRVTEPVWPSDNTLVIQPHRDFDFDLIRLHLERIDFASLNRGSTQPLLTQRDLGAQRFVHASEGVGKAFASIVEQWMTALEGRKANISTLSAIRDALLPRLLSGELSVAQAAHSVEEVA